MSLRPASLSRPLAPLLRCLVAPAHLRAPLSSTVLRPLLTSSSIHHHRLRLAHTIPRPRPLQAAASASSASLSTGEEKDKSKQEQEQDPQRRQPPLRVQSQPHYRLSFTCVPCDTPSTHYVSKQGYHHGSVLITCPHCNNRHVISDHLRIFGDRHITVEDLMRERGRLVRKGTLSGAGDIEFWAENGPAGDDGGGNVSGDDVKRMKWVPKRENRGGGHETTE